MPEQVETMLTVIVVNWNTADLLSQCLEHVFASKVDRIPEVIVVDNGSTDDSVKRVKSQFPGVRVIETGKNLGFAAANNRGMAEAKGKYLLLVNTDAMLAPDCVQRLVECMDLNPSAGMVGPQLLNIDGTRQTSYEAVPTLATEILNRSLLKRIFPKRYPSKRRIFEGPEPVEALIGAVMMIRREAAEQLGGFSEDYFFFLEETDLAVRMRRAGWKVIHIPSARAVHLQGASANEHGAASRIEFYRSRYIFFKKHYGPVSAGILKCALIANLTMNVALLGLLNALTLGQSQRSVSRFRRQFALWKWHLLGQPAGNGLPRG
ncbi:MAG: glycosyltransferase family 2 protein [Deltaproteobacteria bacterium]|nr:glycosyltransferase family 2 protein [Deltaproteobacteria bacterium]